MVVSYPWLSKLTEMLSLSKNELYLKSGLLEATTFDQVNKMSREMNKSFLKVTLNYGFLSRVNFKDQLIKQAITLFEFNYKNLKKVRQISSKEDLDFLLDHDLFPLKSEKGIVDIVAADPSDNISITKFKDRFSLDINTVHIAQDLDIVKAIHLTYGDTILNKAIFSLYDSDPKRSAIETFTSYQILFIGLASIIFLCSLFLYPVNTIILLNLTINLILLLLIGFKFLLSIAGARSENIQKVSKAELKALESKELPYYTILLPVYKESEVIHKLASNLQNLDYPLEKLDIKLLIESDDDVTYNAINDLELPCVLDPVIIPFAQPKTKPKACNYGLYFSKGKYLTIYDAEDIPDSDQLKMVHTLFKKIPDDYVVVQCALNYFNRFENYLTRMFTLEYSYWFDYMLPGLDKLGVPIPLGGTSNHFKLDKLVELGGWDCFNVTEDADLGIRVNSRGYKVTVINSSTYEEANNAFYNWIRQRSRWIKGYMQTYLVHSRSPLQLLNKIGWKGFLGFQFFIGGTALTFLLYPVLLLLFIFHVFLTLDVIESIFGPLTTKAAYLIEILFPDWVLFISVFNFLAGNIIMIYMNMIAVFSRKSYKLILFTLTNPVYWLMHSIAAYKGLFQLISKPFYWEKTNHGLTKTNNPDAR